MPDVISMSLNPNFEGRKRDVIERFFPDIIDSNFTKYARDIKQSILEKSGELGMCSGLITAGWMNMDRMNDRPILVHIRKDHDRLVRKGKKVKEGALFSGFAVLQFKEEATGTYLYIDGLCSNVGKAGALMKFVMKDLGQKLIDAGLIKGFKLSAIGYVIGYYFKKYGFKFYKKKSGRLKEDVFVNNALKDKFSKFVFNSDDEYEVVDEFTGNWNDKLKQLLGDDEMKLLVERSVLKKLSKLNDQLTSLRQPKSSGSIAERRGTLTQRMEIVKEIQQIISEQESKIVDYVARGFTPIYEFYLLAKEHSAENVHILTRNRSDSALAREMEGQSISNEGFYMYQIPGERSRGEGPRKKKTRKKKKTKKKGKKKKKKTKKKGKKRGKKVTRKSGKKGKK